MSFAESFWTADYRKGHQTLFEELYEGIKENEDFIALFTKRMESELQHGRSLQAIPTSTRLLSKRHTNEDYVSTIKNAFEELSITFASQGDVHVQIAENIRELVLEPFTKWCAEHEQRVGYSESVIDEKYKQYSTSEQALKKLEKKYFNKCRMVEEFKSHYSEDELNESMSESAEDLSQLSDQDPEAPGASTTYTFGPSSYDRSTTVKLLSDILYNVELKSHKVPILGTYHNVTTGSAITQWLLDNLPDLNNNVATAEAFGQGFVNNGFIRMVGSMSSNKNFINSSQFHYQWKPAVFELTKVSEFDLSKSAKNANYDPIAASGSRASQFSTYFEDVKQAIGVTTVDFNDKSQYAKLVREVNTLDDQYFETTKSLDLVRCDFEEAVMDHLTFMQKCELDRLKALKKVTFDFISVFSNKISTLKNTSDVLLLVEETIHPASDLKFLVENYATGKFQPHVTLYDNYYNSNIKQTFGVDLNTKARLDKKVVPLLVQVLLSHLDSVYPELENDEQRTDLWTKPIHLSKVHQLRFKLNDLSDLAQIQQILQETDPLVVTNVLKLYFMELPDSIVPNSYFDLIKTLYSSYPYESEDDSSSKSRVTGLQNTLSELPVSNLATLDAVLTHVNRLIQIISSKNESLSSTLHARLCREFGALVLRPKADSAEMEGKNAHTFNMDMEQLQQHFITDLFTHKEQIFGELRRRRSSAKPSRNNSTKERQDKARKEQTPKSRLESKLKRAVSSVERKEPEQKSQEQTPEHQKTQEPKPQKPNPQEFAAASTPPPSPPPKSASNSPSKTTPNPLRRSTSPNKKKLSSLLDPGKSETPSPTPKKRVGSSDDDEIVVVD